MCVPCGHTRGPCRPPHDASVTPDPVGFAKNVLTKPKNMHIITGMNLNCVIGKVGVHHHHVRVTHMVLV